MGLRLFAAARFLGRWMNGKPGDWMEGAKHDPITGRTAPRALFMQSENYYDPDAENDALAAPVKNPVLASMTGEDGKVLAGCVESAVLFEAHYDEAGRMLTDRRVLESKGGKGARPYKLTRYDGDEAVAALQAAEARFQNLPAAAKTAREAKRAHAQQLVEARRQRLAAHRLACEYATAAGQPKPVLESFDDDITGGTLSQFDANQYTEYTPLFGGPYNRQLYLYDYLTMAARAFEAWNHHPLAKRAINIMVQYTLGRGYKFRSDDKKAEKAWKKQERITGLRRKLPIWVREALIFGEIYIDKTTWQTIDPASVWDIITDPEDLEKVYYYHLQWQAPYQMYTGKSVPGAPAGGAKAPATKYIVKQVPADQIIHLKLNCVSQEKRGRSYLFPVLGWLKRIKDLFNAKVVKAQLQASFIWDDLVKGDAADVAAHAAMYTGMPLPGSTFTHNEAVERKPMAALEGTMGGNDKTPSELVAFIGTALGLPKDFLNLLTDGAGSGSRAGAIMGSEPFTKVVEELQLLIEDLLHRIAAEFFAQAGLNYDPDKVEFIFPSVTKDTTSETIKNLQAAESSGYIDKETAATMVAGELNITKYDFKETQKKIAEQVEQGLNLSSGAPPMPGRFGQGEEGGEGAGESPIHGKGAVKTKDALTDL